MQSAKNGGSGHLPSESAIQTECAISELERPSQPTVEDEDASSPRYHAVPPRQLDSISTSYYNSGGPVLGQWLTETDPSRQIESQEQMGVLGFLFDTLAAT